MFSCVGRSFIFTSQLDIPLTPILLLTQHLMDSTLIVIILTVLRQRVLFALLNFNLCLYRKIAHRTTMQVMTVFALGDLAVPNF